MNVKALMMLRLWKDVVNFKRSVKQAGPLLAVVGLRLERGSVAIRVALIAWYPRHAQEWLAARAAI